MSIIYDKTFKYEVGSETLYLPIGRSDKIYRNKNHNSTALGYDLKAFVNEGDWNENPAYFYIVKLGEGYYPLPLLFVSRDEQVKEAEKSGKSLPSEEAIASAIKDIEEYFDVKFK